MGQSFTPSKRSQSYYQLGKIQISHRLKVYKYTVQKSQSYYQLGKIQISVFNAEVIADLGNDKSK